MQDAFAKLLAGDALSQSESESVFTSMLSGELDPAQIGALLALTAARGTTVGELVGAACALRRFATPVTPPRAGIPILDTCGTGGAPKLFNVSTIGALVTAAAASGSVLVAKHGNRSRTGRGSAEILEALGVNILAGPALQTRCLSEIGMCFSFAPHHHPAAKHAAAVRKSLGFPTIFNLLGPLANPAGATHQLVGTNSRENALKLAHALAQLGVQRAMVVTSDDGLDELTTTAVNHVHTVLDGCVTVSTFDARSLGLPRASLDDLRAESLPHALSIARDVLSGAQGPHRDMVLLNTAASLEVAGVTNTNEGLILAAQAIDSGAARRTLDALIRLTNEPA